MRQIAALIALCRGITARRHIRRDRVLAHSDVAPHRKRDPGEKFPWRLLADSGIGLWVEPVAITDWLSLVHGDTGDNVKELQKAPVKGRFLPSRMASGLSAMALFRPLCVLELWE